MTSKNETQQKWDIAPGYRIASVAKIPEEEYLKQFNEHLLQGYPVLPWRSQLCTSQQRSCSQLKKRIRGRYELRLVLLYQDEVVGWTYGWQDGVHTDDFYMAASLVLPEHRRQGLYRALVKRVLEVTYSVGFGAVRSRHIYTNNPVLIAKLKLGFFINGFEQDETVGTVVRTIYYHNDFRKKGLRYRSGKVGEKEVLDSLREASK